jgi:hypothetical protein
VDSIKRKHCQQARQAGVGVRRKDQQTIKWITKAADGHGKLRHDDYASLRLEKQNNQHERFFPRFKFSSLLGVVYRQMFT